MRYFIADFENTVPKPDWQRVGEVPKEQFYELEDVTIDEYGEEHIMRMQAPLPDPANHTYVWAYGIADIHATRYEEVMTGNNIRDFFLTLADIVSKGHDKQIQVYFHNLAYDGPIIMDYLLRCEDMRKANDRWRIAPGEYDYTVSSDNKWYEIVFKFNGSHKLIKIRDSLKILPFSVDSLQKNFKTKLGKLHMPKGFYSKQREPGHVMTEDEHKYLCHDILTVGECLAGVEKFGLLDAMTIGGAALRDFKNRIGKDRYNAFFPELEEDQFVRKGYRGAWCYNSTGGEIIDAEKKTPVTLSGVKRYSDYGYTYDVNSLYPSVLFNHVYPIGNGTWFEPKDFRKHMKDAYFVRFIASAKLKAHMPWVQVKYHMFGKNEYVSEFEDMELTMSRPDFELFLETYEIKEIEIEGGYWYKQARGIFDGYIQHWFEVKASEKHGNKCLYQIAKLYLNNLYGKLAAALTGFAAELYIADGKIARKTIPENRHGGHIAAGAYVTAYARGVTIRAAEANWERFCYADTDSLHLLGRAVGITVGKELGQWNEESKWDKARFVRQKTYIERCIEDEGTPVEPYWNIKACGASKEVKDRIAHKVTFIKNNKIIVLDPDESNICSDEELLEKFTYGLFETGKLVHKTVKGGSILVETTFRIAPPMAERRPIADSCLTTEQLYDIINKGGCQ